MMRVTLRQLQTFETVARLRSFSRAAEEMFVSQPTVSKQIKLLQEEIGIPLLDQIGKKLYLTEAGKELYATCGKWLNTWGRFEQTIADLKGMKQGRLTISAVTTTKYFMPRILGPFCQQYPGIDVSLELLNRNRVLERLANNEDDIYIMGVPPEEVGVVTEPFFENILVIVAPINHPLTKRKRIPFKTLEKEPFILRESGSGTRLLLENMFKQHKLKLNVRMELGSNEAIKQAVIGGLGLSLLSKSSLSFEPSYNEIAILNVQGFPVKRDWYVVHHKDKQPSVVTQTFLDYLIDHVQLLKPRSE